MASDVSNAFNEFGGAVSSLFGASGATASAGSYEQAAALAAQNAKISKTATAIKETQESRQIFRVIGKQRAGIGGANFAESGTALDLLRSSASEGALTKALTAQQGAISENSYAEQAGLYMGLAGTAKTSATGQAIGGIIQGAGGALSAYNAAKGFFNTGPTAADIAASSGKLGSGSLAEELAAGAPELSGISDLVEGGSFLDAIAGETIVDAGVEFGVEELATAAVVWVVCTELHRQGRMPSRLYYSAASEFIAYPERGKRGYYLWAIPSTRHLRAHPQSWYSRLLCRTFNCRARYIANRKRGRATTWAGAFVTHGLFAVCWGLSWFVPASLAQWQGLYRA